MPKIWERRGAAVYEGTDCIALFDCDNRSTSEIEANAQVAAAAPDLLASCRALKAELDALEWGQPYHGRPHAIVDAADAAIAKAEGR